MIPNPNAPDEYKYETDYRKIPRKYLNPKIPQGRGKIKWQPFATLPEQFETIYQYMIDQNKVSRPVLSDDQLSQLNIHLHEALQQSRPVNIKYYEEGYINFIELIIHRIDSMNYEIEGTAPHSRERHKVSFLDIIDISFI